MKKILAPFNRLLRQLRCAFYHQPADGLYLGRGWVVPTAKRNHNEKAIDWVYDCYSCRHCGIDFAVSCTFDQVVAFVIKHDDAEERRQNLRFKESA
jgi:hypothetical protein